MSTHTQWTLSVNEIVDFIHVLSGQRLQTPDYLFGNGGVLVSGTVDFPDSRQVELLKLLSVSVEVIENGSRHHDCTLKPVSRHRREDMQADRPSAGTLSHQGHPLWVAAKVANVLLDPLQGGGLIKQALIAAHLGHLTGVEKPKCRHAIVNGHHDGVGSRRQHFAIVQIKGRRANGKCSAVYPYQNCVKQTHKKNKMINTKMFTTNSVLPGFSFSSLTTATSGDQMLR